MDEPKNDPAKKMRVLLDGGKPSAIARLPKNTNAASPLPLMAEKKPGTSTKEEETPHASPKPVSPSKGIRFNFGPPFWTIASVLSLTINIVLLIILLGLWVNLRILNVNVSSVMGMGNGLLGGLYTNFEKMDRAHITTTIPVETTIPVKFDLQLNQQTNVVLSQDVTINNALVTVKTGGLNIVNALTTIVLPQGTVLPIVLNLTVPVDKTVPVSLKVEVDIPLEKTQLHEPFSGLQEVVKPFYCMLNPAALNLGGQSVCK